MTVCSILQSTFTDMDLVHIFAQNVELPPMLELEAQDQRLRERWRGLNQAYIKSPYNLKANLPKGCHAHFVPCKHCCPATTVIVSTALTLNHNLTDPTLNFCRSC